MKTPLLRAIYLGTLFCGILIYACSKDNTDDMSGNNMVDCSTLQPKWSTEIEGIIASNCALSGCHAGSTSQTLFTSYEGAFSARNNVRSRVVAKSMPPAGRPVLTQETIDLINCWVMNGAPQ